MVANQLQAAKRLRKELLNLRKEASANNATTTTTTTNGAAGSQHKQQGQQDDSIDLQCQEHLLRWKAWIRGPDDTPYEHGVFELSVVCSTDYPLAPPTIKFVTKVFHPNVHFRTGDICLDILKKEWSPAWGLQAACRAVLALLSDPDADSPLNCDAGNMVRGGDMNAFNGMARMYTAENAMFQEWPVGAAKDEGSG